MRVADSTTPEGPVLRLYELISGPADRERPWDEISSLFLSWARIRMEVVEEGGPESPPVARGINSVQVLRREGH